MKVVKSRRLRAWALLGLSGVILGAVAALFYVFSWSVETDPYLNPTPVEQLGGKGDNVRPQLLYRKKEVPIADLAQETASHRTRTPLAEGGESSLQGPRAGPPTRTITLAVHHAGLSDGVPVQSAFAIASDESDAQVFFSGMLEADESNEATLDCALPVDWSGRIVSVLDGVLVEWESDPTITKSHEDMSFSASVSDGVGLAIRFVDAESGEPLEFGSIVVKQDKSRVVNGVVIGSSGRVGYSLRGHDPESGRVPLRDGWLRPIVLPSSFASEEVTVHAMSPGKRPLVGRFDLPRIGRVAVYELAMEPPLPEVKFAVLVQVLSPVGSPIVGAHVEFSDQAQLPAVYQPEGWQSRDISDESGTARLWRLSRTESKTQTRSILVRADTYQSKEVEVQLIGNQEDFRTTVRLDPISGRTHRVRILDQAGLPISGVEVQVKSSSKENKGQVLALGLTDSGGECVVSGMPESTGTVEIDVSSPNVLDDPFTRSITFTASGKMSISQFRFLKLVRIELVNTSSSEDLVYSIYPNTSSDLQRFVKHAEDFLNLLEKPRSALPLLVESAFSYAFMQNRSCVNIQLKPLEARYAYLADGDYQVLCQTRPKGEAVRAVFSTLLEVESGHDSNRLELAVPALRMIEVEMGVVLDGGERLPLPAVSIWPGSITPEMASAFSATTRLSRVFGTESLDFNQAAQLIRDGTVEELMDRWKAVSSALAPITNHMGKQRMYVPEGVSSLSFWSPMIGHRQEPLVGGSVSVVVDPYADFAIMRISGEEEGGLPEVRLYAPFLKMNIRLVPVRKPNGLGVPLVPPGGGYSVSRGGMLLSPIADEHSYRNPREGVLVNKRVRALDALEDVSLVGDH